MSDKNNTSNKVIYIDDYLRKKETKRFNDYQEELQEYERLLASDNTRWHHSLADTEDSQSDMNSSTDCSYSKVTPLEFWDVHNCDLYNLPISSNNMDKYVDDTRSKIRYSIATVVIAIFVICIVWFILL